MDIERCVKYKTVNMEGEITPQINVQNEGYAKWRCLNWQKKLNGQDIDEYVIFRDIACEKIEICDLRRIYVK